MLFTIKNAHKFIFKPVFNFSKTPFSRSLTADLLLDENIKPRKRTKTVCTIGYFFHYIDQKVNHLKWLGN